jgi:membrane-associated protein
MFVALGSITFGDLSSGWVLVVVCVILTIAAILGNISGYYLGRVIGPPLFKPRDGFMGKVFNPKYVDMTHRFFDKYGSRALILARFVPMVRTFVTLVAGVGRMDFRKFITYTAIGGVLWATGVTVLGYFLGTIPFIHENIEAALVLIVFVSLIPMIIEFVLAKRRSKAAAAALATAVDDAR